MTPSDSTDLDQSVFATVSWGAVIAGGITAAALTLLLLAFGVGVGLSAVSPWSDEGVSATTFTVAAGVYLVAIAMLSSTVGGYIAGRMRAKWVGVHDHEIYFRDTAHGLLAWALATVIGATLLGSAATHILTGAAGGAAAAAAQTNPTDVYVDALLRADAGTSPAPGGAGASTPSAGANDLRSTRGELARLMAPTLRKGGDLSSAERSYAAKVVSARTGLSQADAEKRVSDTVAQAKKAADDARKALAAFALWLAASMLAGAVAAMLGATEGGLLRDSKWHEPGWRSTIVRTHI
jgi:hypothetical protein